MNFKIFKFNSFTIKFFIVLLFFFYSFNYTEAAFIKDDYSKNLKTIKSQINAINDDSTSYTQKYIDLYQNLFILQVENKKFDDALKTSNIIIEANKQLYGENSESLANSYIQQFYLNISSCNPSLAKLSLEKAKNIIFTINSLNLKKTYYKAESCFYNTYQSYFKSVESLNKLLDLGVSSDEEKLELYQLLIGAYQGTFNVKETLKLFDEYLNLNLKLYGQDNERLITYYHQLLSFKLIVESDFKNFTSTYNKLVSLTEKFGNSLEIQFYNDFILADYYMKINDFNNLKLHLDNIKSKINETKSYQYENNLNSYYLTYFQCINDKKSANKIIKNLKTFNKETNKFTPVNSVYFLEKFVDFNKYKDNYRVANKTSKKILEILSPYAEDAPVLQGKFLKNMALVQRDIGRFDNALNALYKSELAYKKELPDVSYPLYETAIEFAILYRIYGRFQESFPYYEKAKNICFELFGENHYDMLKIYINIADTQYFAGMKQQALESLEKALNIAINLYGKDNIQVKTLLDRKSHYLNTK